MDNWAGSQLLVGSRGGEKKGDHQAGTGHTPAPHTQTHTREV